jgi:hypothetical protein
MNASMVHATAQKGCVDVVFLPHLPIWIVNLRGIRYHQRVMIQERFTREKITRQLRTSRVARTTGVEDLLWIAFTKMNRRRLLTFRGMLVVLDMILKRPMARLTTHRHFSHGGVIGVLL